MYKNFVQVELGKIFDIVSGSICPYLFPNEEFVHHSLPAFDSTRGPAIEFGRQIESNKTLLSEPVVLLSKLNPRTSRVSLADPTNDTLRHCCSTEFIAYKAKEDGVSNVFYNYFFQTDRFRIRLQNVAIGTTNSHVRVTPSETLDWKVPYPPKAEQTKIAEILSTVDRAIEQTEAIIAKQQRIKTGLMQDLLTRGIDEHGNIRAEETHEFKDSPLGRIPVEWAVKTLFEVYAEIPKNGIFKTAKEIGRGSLMIGQTSFTSDRRINYKNSRRATVSISELMAYKLQENDILVTRVYATVYGVGLPVLVEEIPEPAVYESNMLRLRVDTNQILPKYTFYWLMSAPIRTFIVASVNASNQTSINQQVMNSIPITFPKKTEQETIVGILAKSERSIEDSTSSFRKLQSLKTALMQDLLTGKKRVTALLNDTEEITS